MGTEAERQDTRKAMAYDIIQILKEKPEKQTYKDLQRAIKNWEFVPDAKEY